MPEAVAWVIIGVVWTITIVVLAYGYYVVER